MTAGIVFVQQEKTRETFLSFNNMSYNLNVIKPTMGRPMGGMIQKEEIATIKIQNDNNFSLEG